jgi:S1-C subfamily serine protease
MRRSDNSCFKISFTLVMALALLGCRQRQDEPPAQDGSGSSAELTDEQVQIVYPSAPGSFVELVTEVRPSILHLRSSHKVQGGPASLLPEPEDSNALGTAFVLRVDGILVTNEHVIATAPEISAVFTDGFEAPATVVGRDTKLDLTLLKIDVPLIPSAPRLKPAREL